MISVLTYTMDFKKVVAGEVINRSVSQKQVTSFVNRSVSQI